MFYYRSSSDEQETLNRQKVLIRFLRQPQPSIFKRLLVFSPIFSSAHLSHFLETPKTASSGIEFSALMLKKMHIRCLSGRISIGLMSCKAFVLGNFSVFNYPNNRYNKNHYLN